MKYLSLLFLLVLSKFTSGQHVFTKFEKVVLYDDFSYVSSRWEQKSTSSESYLVSGSNYVIKRLKDSYFTISLPNEVEEYANFDLVTSIKLEADKDNKLASGGVVLKAQKSGDGALIVEFNANKEYRIRMLESGKMSTLFGEKNNGWQKSKNLFPYGYNEIRVVTAGNEYDLYFNQKYERTFIETTFEAGRIGFFANAKSGISVDYVIVRANQTAATTTRVTENTSDQTYTELALVFKVKIDKQQKEIDELNQALNKCKSSLLMDTTSIKENKTLKKENSEMKMRLQVLESELERAKDRMKYLESMKADIESGSNGDLILNLTELLAREKAKSEELLKENEKLKRELKENQQRY